nr:putative aquaporin [Ipomoea batatas]
MIPHGESPEKIDRRNGKRLSNAGFYQIVTTALLLYDPRALAAPALSTYWWYSAAMAAPTNGPTQNIHCLVFAIDDSSSKAPSRVNACAGEISVNIKTYRNMGVSGISLGVSGGEDSVNKNKSPNYLGAQTSAFAVPILQSVCPAAIPHIVSFLEGLHQPTSADGSQALRHHLTRNTGSAVNKDEDHATKGPCNSKNAHAATFVSALHIWVSLALVPNHSENSDVEKQEGGDELGYDRPVK